MSADRRDVDAKLRHEVDAEEGHQRHPRRDRNEIGPDYDADSSI